MSDFGASPSIKLVSCLTEPVSWGLLPRRHACTPLASRNLQGNLMVAQTDDLTLDRSAARIGLQGYLVHDTEMRVGASASCQSMACEG